MRDAISFARNHGRYPRNTLPEAMRYSPSFPSHLVHTLSFIGAFSFYLQTTAHCLWPCAHKY